MESAHRDSHLDTLSHISESLSAVNEGNADSSAYEGLHDKIQQAVTGELREIAQLSDPKEIIDRSRRLAAVSASLREHLPAYEQKLEAIDRTAQSALNLPIHPSGEGADAAIRSAGITNALLELGVTLNPSSDKPISSEHLAHHIAVLRSAAPGDQDLLRSVDRLAARAMLRRVLKTRGEQGIAPWELKELIQGCEAAFKPDVRWPLTKVHSLYEIRVLLEQNLRPPGDELPSRELLRSIEALLTKVREIPNADAQALAMTLIKVNDAAWTKVDAEFKDALAAKNYEKAAELTVTYHAVPRTQMVNGVIRAAEGADERFGMLLAPAFAELLVKVDISNAMETVRAITALRTVAREHRDIWQDESMPNALDLLANGLRNIAQLNPSDLTSDQRECLSLIGTGLPAMRGFWRGDLRVENFYLKQWPAQVIRSYAPGVEPDFTLKLKDSEEARCHLAVLAHEEGLFSVFRLPGSYKSSPLHEQDLRQFRPADVHQLLRALYGLPVSMKSTDHMLLPGEDFLVSEEPDIDPKLVVYCCGVDVQALLKGSVVPPPRGKDAASDLEVKYDGGVLHAHRVIVGHRLGEAVGSVLDWSALTKDEAQLALDLLYSDYLDPAAAHQLMQAAEKPGQEKFKTFVQAKLEWLVECIPVMMDSISVPEIDPVACRDDTTRLITQLGLMNQRDLQRRARTEFAAVKDGWRDEVDRVLSSDHKPSPMELWKAMRMLVALNKPKEAEVVRTRFVRALYRGRGSRVLDSTSEGIKRLDWGKELFALGAVELSSIDQHTLLTNLAAAPGLQLDLRGTTIDESFVKEMLDEKLSLNRISWEGCNGLPAAVQQMLEGKAPDPETFDEVTPLMRRLAALGTIEMQERVVSKLVADAQKSDFLDVRGFSLAGGVDKALLKALRGVNPEGLALGLDGSTVTEHLLLRLLDRGWKLWQLRLNSATRGLDISDDLMALLLDPTAKPSGTDPISPLTVRLAADGNLLARQWIVDWLNAGNAPSGSVLHELARTPDLVKEVRVLKLAGKQSYALDDVKAILNSTRQLKKLILEVPEEADPDLYSRPDQLVSEICALTRLEELDYPQEGGDLLALRLQTACPFLPPQGDPDIASVKKALNDRISSGQDVTDQLAVLTLKYPKLPLATWVGADADGKLEKAVTAHIAGHFVQDLSSLRHALRCISDGQISLFEEALAPRIGGTDRAGPLVSYLRGGAPLSNELPWVLAGLRRLGAVGMANEDIAKVLANLIRSAPDLSEGEQRVLGELDLDLDKLKEMDVSERILGEFIAKNPYLERVHVHSGDLMSGMHVMDLACDGKNVGRVKFDSEVDPDYVRELAEGSVPTTFEGWADQDRPSVGIQLLAQAAEESIDAFISHHSGKLLAGDLATLARTPELCARLPVLIIANEAADYNRDDLRTVLRQSPSLRVLGIGYPGAPSLSELLPEIIELKNLRALRYYGDITDEDLQELAEKCPRLIELTLPGSNPDLDTRPLTRNGMLVTNPEGGRLASPTPAELFEVLEERGPPDAAAVADCVARLVFAGYEVDSLVDGWLLGSIGLSEEVFLKQVYDQLFQLLCEVNSDPQRMDYWNIYFIPDKGFRSEAFRREILLRAQALLDSPPVDSPEDRRMRRLMEGTITYLMALPREDVIELPPED